MKVLKNIVCLLLIVAVAGNVNADEKKKKGKGNQRTPKVTQRFVAKMELSDDQKTQVAEIDKTFAPKLAELTKKKQAILTKEQIAELTKATFKSKVHYPTYDCYFPHHIFIFYDDFGDPRACIEVCFECVAIKYARNLKDPTFPKEIYTTEEESDPFGGGVPQYEDWSPFQATGDFLAIAKICIDSGMGLGTFKTIEEFQEKHQPAK